MTVRSKILSSIKNRIKYKPVHRLAKQVNVLVSTQSGSLPKGKLRTDISIVITPTLLCRLYCWCSISLWCHNSPSCVYYCLHLLIISVRLFKILSCVALLLIFRLDITCIVLFLSCTTDVSLEFPTIYQHSCFVPLVSRFHWKVQSLFCIFGF